MLISLMRFHFFFGYIKLRMSLFSYNEFPFAINKTRFSAWWGARESNFGELTKLFDSCEQKKSKRIKI